MAKKYELPQDDIQMVEEPSTAYMVQYNYKSQINVPESDDSTWEDMAITNPKLNISVDELRQMGRECINASCLSAEDAIRHFMSIL